MFLAKPIVWPFVDSPNNPIFQHINGSGHNEFYKPTVCDKQSINTGSGAAMLYSMTGKTTDNVWAATSPDLENWTLTSGGIVKATGAGGTWNSSSVFPGYMWRDPNSLLWYLYYGGSKDFTNTSVGLAVTAGTNFGTTFEESSISPLWTPAQYNAASGDRKENVKVDCVIKVSPSEYWFFGIAFNDDQLAGALVYGVSSDLLTPRLDTVILQATDLKTDCTIITAPSVFKHPVTGKYVITISTRRLVPLNGFNSEWIISATSQSSTQPIFRLADFRTNKLIDTNVSIPWKESEVYANCWLCKNDMSGDLVNNNGVASLFWAGHEQQDAPYTSAFYTGCPCRSDIAINAIPIIR